MKKAILATKVGMTQIFAEDGTLIPVTVLEAGPNVVTQIKTADNDGYDDNTGIYYGTTDTPSYDSYDTTDYYDAADNYDAAGYYDGSTGY